MGSASIFALCLLLLVLIGCDAIEKQPSVIIVGAGMAGIMAAKTLSENGIHDFLILEATDRIGGRMREADFAGKRIELGANWVEGVNATTTNPIWKLAQEYKLKTYFSDFSNLSSNIYTQSGFLDPKTSNKLFQLSEDSSDFVDDLGISKTKSKAPDMSVLSAQRLEGKKIPSTPVEMVLDYYNYDYEFAEPPRVTSLKNTQPNPTFDTFGDDNYLVIDQRGYSYIVEALAKTFMVSKNGTLADSRLQLNKVVRKIVYSNQTGVTVSTENGKTYTSKYVIVTVSLGVLQSGLIQFSPSLPEWKVEALSEFDMAVYTKIFLKFPYKFWPSTKLTEFFLYADEKRGYYPIWQHLENEFPGSNVMFVTVTDDESRRIEQQSNNETQAEIMDVLRNMFGKSVPEPQEILVPRWWSNRFFVGSFSNWPIGVEAYEFERIQAPLNPLYFSGEHTHEHYNGYVHGAYYSGIDAAKTLLGCIKKHKCSNKAPKAPAHRTGDKRRRNMENSESWTQKEREVQRRKWKKQLQVIFSKQGESVH